MDILSYITERCFSQKDVLSFVFIFKKRCELFKHELWTILRDTQRIIYGYNKSCVYGGIYEGIT